MHKDCPETFKSKIRVRLLNLQLALEQSKRTHIVEKGSKYISVSDSPGISGRAQPSTFLFGILITVSALQVFSLKKLIMIKDILRYKPNGTFLTVFNSVAILLRRLPYLVIRELKQRRR